MKVRGFLSLLRPIVLLTVVILGLAPAAAGAQPGAAPAAAVIQPSTQLEIPPPKLRTWPEMEAAAALEAAGPLPPPRVKPFRPTIGEAAYKALKAKAAQAPPAPAAPGITAPAPLAPTALTSTISFDGNSQGAASGNLYPPDTEGAAGPNHFVEITNSHLDIYLKQAAPNPPVKSVPLSSFFKYTAQALFDPRVLYDSVSQRWIISADAFPEPGTVPPVQWFFFAVSQTADPMGNFFIYQVNVSANSSTALWDFPQIGLDQNAVIFTANFFDGNPQVFVDARMFTVAKSILYNGPSQTLTPPLFTNLVGTLSAPIVLDTNPNTYLVAADIAGSSVTIYTLTNSGANPPTLSGAATIPVTAYTAPATAPQPGQGTTHLIDTSDARFVNAGTQIGNSLFQVHSIDNGAGHAICRFYEFDTVNKTVIQYGDFSASGTSYDFNASIAANRRKDVFVTWSATDPTNNVYAEVLVSGRLHSDPAGVIPSPGPALFQSTVALTGNSVKPNPPRQDLTQRWGDYSAVSLDPADPSGSTAWIVNERIVSASVWGSGIGRISLPRHLALPGVDLLLLGY